MWQFAREAIGNYTIIIKSLGKYKDKFSDKDYEFIPHRPLLKERAKDTCFSATRMLTPIPIKKKRDERNNVKHKHWQGCRGRGNPPRPPVSGWTGETSGRLHCGLGPSKNIHTPGLCSLTPGHVFQRNSHTGLKGSRAEVYAWQCCLQ